MANFLNFLRRKEFVVGDSVVIYVNCVSDVDHTIKRGFYEGVVTSIIDGNEKRGVDRRYLITCEHNFRDGHRVDDKEVVAKMPVDDKPKLKNRRKVNQAANQVEVSENSPFLLTPREYILLRCYDELSSQYICEITDVLMGAKVEDFLSNWQASVLWIMSKLGFGWKKVVSEMTEDFHPKCGLSLKQCHHSSIAEELDIVARRLASIRNDLCVAQ